MNSFKKIDDIQHNLNSFFLAFRYFLYIIKKMN